MFWFEAEVAIKATQSLARLQSLNLLRVQINFCGNVMDKLDQQFYFEAAHYSKHAVRIDTELVLSY
jgi:hypothetical protein